MKRKFACCAVFFVAGLSLHARSLPLRVVTTMSYLKYVAEQVGGDHVSVVALANPRQDPHYVTPTPRMNQIAYNADLFIEHGLNLDLWAKNVLDASGNPKIQPGSSGHLVATINVPVKELPTEVSRSWGDIHPQGNPHCWLDPFNIRIIAENVERRLIAVDPSNADAFARNYRAFIDRLDAAMFGEDLLKSVGPKAGDILTRKTRNDELIPWLQARHLTGRLGGWLAKAERLQGMPVITYHKTYVYFSERFGLNVIAEREDKPGIPPPPQRRDAVVEAARSSGVRVILNDNFYSREAADYVASKSDARVLLTYIDVGASPEVDTYEHLITYLVENILQAGR